MRTIIISLIIHSFILITFTSNSTSTIGIIIVLMVLGTSAWITTPAN
ncbi:MULTISPECIES: hypothetical protein [Bacillaceae]|nr:MULTISPECIES: hypothetical protein [Bacillaceae]MCE4048689.1 hypothetical protein [Bacillus sp. Au-Bac7]MCM3032795.1 hypothetical protein [Niallia sp. MER 6]